MRLDTSDDLLDRADLHEEWPREEREERLIIEPTRWSPNTIQTHYSREELEALRADAFGEDYEHYDNPYGCSWLDIM